MVFASIFSKGIFLQPRNFVNLILQNSGLIIVTIGQLLVIAVAGIDLSVGAVMAVSSVLVVLFQDYGLAGAFAIALGGSLIFGLVNGVLVTFIRLPAFVVTMATMQIGYSVAKLLSDAAGSRGGTVYTSLLGSELPTDFTAFYKTPFLGIPQPLFICLAFLIIIAIYLRSSNGHFIFPVGGNEKTALSIRSSGLDGKDFSLCTMRNFSWSCRDFICLTGWVGRPTGRNLDCIGFHSCSFNWWGQPFRWYGYHFRNIFWCSDIECLEQYYEFTGCSSHHAAGDQGNSNFTGSVLEYTSKINRYEGARLSN